ncbi:prepilin peptidase [Roseateles sp.]|uniref:prepilin peptidase n=1 Tax=Roseateles sp. TaxID=1971397 RepID=UPI0031DB3CDB
MSTLVSAPVTLAALALVLGGAVRSDLRVRRVTNRWLAFGLALALGLHAAALAAGSPAPAGERWWSPLGGAATGLALMLPLYLLRAMGAADVKLMAVVGAFAGAATVAAAVLYTMLAGGLLSLLAMRDASVLARVMASMRAQRRASSAHAPGASPLARTAARLPYAVAIAMGTAMALIAPPLI